MAQPTEDNQPVEAHLDAEPVATAAATDAQPLEPVPISALEHYSYCPRQCALIHVEQTFDENIYTLRGRMLHERVDEPASETQGAMRVERGLPIFSLHLGLVGKADLVEFHGDTPYPVEYKHGPIRSASWRTNHAALQACAQAMCLEEMTGKSVPLGAIYHQASYRRKEVIFDAALRQRVEETVKAVRALLSKRELPRPVNDARCRNCSLNEACLPGVSRQKTSALAASVFRLDDT
jgi:CRISPR-associated exonuclease Cas4